MLYHAPYLIVENIPPEILAVSVIVGATVGAVVFLILGAVLTVTALVLFYWQKKTAFKYIAQGYTLLWVNVGKL